jgi:hypothetical protein
MNRKAYGLMLTIVLLTLGFLTGCSSSSSTPPPPPPVVAISATSGTPQTATISTAFAAPLVATVTTGGTPTAGVTVTFTAPSSGAGGTFAGGTNTATTDANGVATSGIFTANSTAGAYTVTATAPGASAPASFSLTNTAVSVETITATSGSGQSATISTAFAAPLVATIMTGSTPNVGAVVTFTAPSTGASGTFADSGTAVTTATTNASGVATSAAFTANATAGGPYNVVASATGAVSANFSLTNAAAGGSSTNYTFYMSGEELINAGPNYYALAGAITVDDATGNVVGGEQDYNDAFGITSPSTGDTITGGTLTVSSTTGEGTLTLITNNTSVGAAGTETFTVQFVNTNHALITQFDGTATSGGSMDVQTLPSTLGGGYSFIMSGVDPSYSPTAFGGIFSLSGTALTSGFFDVNDAGTVQTNVPFTATVSAADSFGRGTITGAFVYGSTPVVLAYYVVNSGVIRMTDVDSTDAAIGSAFSQGAASFTNASIGSCVLAIAGNPFQSEYGALGQLTTSNTSTDPANFAGVGEDSELDNSVQTSLASQFSGTYTIGSDGYGSLTASTALGDVSLLGIYAVDPTLNLNDPNNTTSGGGGALVLDLDASLSGGTGVLIPQTDAASTSFAGNYVAGWQDFNYYFSGCPDCEFDMVAQGSMVANGALSLAGPVSDPFLTWAATATSTGNTFSGTPAADGSNPGRYSMLSANSNALSTPNGVPVQSFDVVMYQASGGQLFWLNYDTTLFSVFSGPLEQQGDLTGLPLARRPAVKTQAKQKR